MFVVIRRISQSRRAQKRRRLENFHATSMRKSCESEIIRVRKIFLEFFERLFRRLVKQKRIVRRGADECFAFRKTRFYERAKSFQNVVAASCENFPAAIFCDFFKRVFRIVVARQKISFGKNFFHRVERPRKNAFAAQVFQGLSGKPCRGKSALHDYRHAISHQIFPQSLSNLKASNKKRRSFSRTQFRAEEN